MGKFRFLESCWLFLHLILVYLLISGGYAQSMMDYFLFIVMPAIACDVNRTLLPPLITRISTIYVLLIVADMFVCGWEMFLNRNRKLL